jgi:NAD-dependent protein deacetylase/lipoamidase
VATPQGFARDPVLVHGFYNLRRSWHKQARPDAAHLALARLEREHGNVLTVTQNIDALHEAAGTTNLIHMHGELERALCAACGVIAPWKEESIETLCQACGEAAMRPGVVWLGEMPREMERIYDALGGCDLFISMGTNGTVYPAAGFVMEASASASLQTAPICSWSGSKALPPRSSLLTSTAFLRRKHEWSLPGLSRQSMRTK